jgi:hypothetical protein
MAVIRKAEIQGEVGQVALPDSKAVGRDPRSQPPCVAPEADAFRLAEYP